MAIRQHRCPADPEVGSHLFRAFLVDTKVTHFGGKHNILMKKIPMMSLSTWAAEREAKDEACEANSTNHHSFLGPTTQNGGKR